MAVDLPKPIADYFAAEGKDGSATARCFTEDAVVVDERRNHVGRVAIEAWKTEVSTKYHAVSEPMAVVEEGGRVIVTSRVSGDFPGSPIDLRHAFVLEAGAIARLEIVP